MRIQLLNYCQFLCSNAAVEWAAVRQGSSRASGQEARPAGAVQCSETCVDSMQTDHGQSSSISRNNNNAEFIAGLQQVKTVRRLHIAHSIIFI